VSREEIIYGKYAVEQAIDARRVKRIWALDHDPKGVRIQVLMKAKEAGIRVDLVDRRYLDDRMGRANHQGIIAKIEPFEYRELDELLAGEPPSGPLLILDRLNDPGNFGNIIRTSAAFGAGGIIIAKDRAVGVTPTVEKAASGTIHLVPIIRETNLASAIDKLKEAGYWVYGTDAEQGEIIGNVDLKGKVAVVLGAEAKGLSRLVRERCDAVIRIPVAPEVESLNVAATAAVFLYEIRRQSGFGADAKQ
jgi:23S rRNA (guanosine2251-2'-O)-methyltransferase